MGLRVLHEEPEFSELFISHLLSRNARVEADLVDQLFNSSEKLTTTKLSGSVWVWLFSRPMTSRFEEKV